MTSGGAMTSGGNSAMNDANDISSPVNGVKNRGGTNKKLANGLNGKHENGSNGVNGHSHPDTFVGGIGSGIVASHSGANRQPTSLPPFGIADIRKAIPPHCFQRSYFKSFQYLFVDLAIVIALFYCTPYIDTVFSNERFGASLGFLLRHVAWTAYWIVQGCVMTGLWVIAHECGHGGFSDSTVVNDVVGWIVHSGLLVPYFSWKISHRRHHAATNNLSRDEVFVPTEAPGTRAAAHMDIEEEESTLLHTKRAIIRMANIIIMLTLGWPLYLIMNATGRPYPRGTFPNHFLPQSPIFSEKERPFIILSDVGLVIAFYILGQVWRAHGFAWLFYSYGVPYLIVNMWLVLITYLQHTDRVLPHYADGEWDWLRGALATIDRDYGILNMVHHHIADTHVVHHLFSNMPHYHAEEATRAVRPLLGKYYCYDNTPIFKALWQSYGKCNYIKKDESITTSKDSSKPKGVYWF